MPCTITKAMMNLTTGQMRYVIHALFNVTSALTVAFAN
jgi:hypothetical protein